MLKLFARNEQVIRVEQPKPTFLRKKTEDISLYEELAVKVGYNTPTILIDKFERFLLSNDIPVFNLQEVIRYMDEKSLEASCKEHNHGWGWIPLRECDVSSMPHRMIFGNVGRYGGQRGRMSDYCAYTANARPYAKAIPLHALKKVALITETFENKVLLFVSDYINSLPDPFLMAVIPNERVEGGIGRFVIDFWNEPGFGLSKQLI